MSTHHPFLYPRSAEAQLSLGLGEQAPSERLFFALMPEPTIATAIAGIGAELISKHRLRTRPLSSERLHVTLHHLGDYAGLPPSLLQHAARAAARVRAEPFEVQFDRVGSFGGRAQQQPCVLRGDDGLQPLIRLQRSLLRRLAEQGITGDSRFTAHLTLLYSEEVLPWQRIAPVQWRVEDFVLIRSFLGQTRYQLEGRWPLRSAV